MATPFYAVSLFVIAKWLRVFQKRVTVVIMETDETPTTTQGKHPIYWVAIMLIIFNVFLFLGKTLYDNRKSEKDEPAESSSETGWVIPESGERAHGSLISNSERYFTARQAL